MRIIGIVLVVIGIIGLVYGGISWTQREEVVDMGPIEVTAQDRESIPMPPIVGGICLAVGAVMLLRGGRRSAV
jgi:hypothetical protein